MGSKTSREKIVLWRFFLKLCFVSINKLSDITWKRVNRALATKLAASSELLGLRQNITSLSLLYGYYFGGSYLVNSSSFYFSWKLSSSQDFSVTISACYKCVMSAISFLIQLKPKILYWYNALLNFWYNLLWV